MTRCKFLSSPRSLLDCSRSFPQLFRRLNTAPRQRPRSPPLLRLMSARSSLSQVSRNRQSRPIRLSMIPLPSASTKRVASTLRKAIGKSAASKTTAAVHGGCSMTSPARPFLIDLRCMKSGRANAKAGWRITRSMRIALRVLPTPMVMGSLNSAPHLLVHSMNHSMVQARGFSRLMATSSTRTFQISGACAMLMVTALQSSN